MVIDLRTQLKYYKKEMSELRQKKGHSEAPIISSSAVYLFSIGTNDYISPFLLNSTTLMPSYHHSQYVEMAIHKRGGRKFVFLNLGELGCLPGLRILRAETKCGGCLEEASYLAKLHNKALKTLLSEMEQQLHGFKYFLYDFNSSLAQKITQPSKYGFKEGKKACCGTGHFNGIFSCGGKRVVKDYELCNNPSEFVFWDSYHLTERVYKQMADQMWSRSLKKFFLCF
ncbi:hypothetical protein CDL12_26310 [Handroanthus impetiginosus]|uniref:Triacylglycerol lipase n=1 Tax=Handroanthus impetiginosus TaxID=429701 RepID=A0A2G9G7A8_9LAMI|nr:hypothetical protein CDL12_26310 [Handroanthus impetiginosus]